MNLGCVAIEFLGVHCHLLDVSATVRARVKFTHIFSEVACHRFGHVAVSRGGVRLLVLG